jgi:uncharacterized membrane protein
MWIFLALLSAILAATRRTQEKRLTSRLNHFSMAFATQVLGLPIIGCTLLIHGVLLNPLHLGLRFWLPLVGTSIGFYPLNAFLYLQAIKKAEISSILPLQSLWPVFSLVPAWLTLGEVPSALGILGILLTVGGVYALGLKGRALHHPLQPFRESQASRYMIGVVLLMTVAGVLDKIAIPASDAIYYSFASTIGAIVTLGAMLCLTSNNELRKLLPCVKELGIIGTLQGVSYTTYLMAIGLGPIAYVASVRSSNVLMGSLLGIAMLHERFTKAKLLSFCLIATGALFLAFN